MSKPVPLDMHVPIVRREFAGPQILKWPLEIGVTVIAAHCRTRSGLERDYQLKRAMGFPPEHGTRIHGLLRRDLSRDCSR